MKVNWKITAGVTAATAAGAALRAWPIASRPLWFDEAADWLSSSPTVGLSLAGTPLKSSDFFLWKHDFEAAPLTFFMRWEFMKWMGSEQVWVQRLPALICAIMCIPVAFWLGRVVRSNTLGLLLAVMVALDPNMVDLGQQSRSYPMLSLLTLLAIIVAIKVLRPAPVSSETANVTAERPERAWALPLQFRILGLILGLAFCTTQFGIAVWFGITLAAGALLVGGWLIRQPHPAKWRVVHGVELALLYGSLVSAPGLINLFTKDSQRGWGASMTYPAIAVEIATAAKDLISPQRIGLLMYVPAAIGLYFLFRRCKTSSVVLVCVAFANVLMLFPFRKSHHFMAPRYLSLIQPALWTGLAMLPLLPAKRIWQIAGSGVLILFVSLNAYHAINLDSWFTGPDTNKYLVGPQIIAAKKGVTDRNERAAAFAYQPEVLDKLGRYYHAPMDSRLERGFYDNYQDRPDPQVPEEFDRPITYLIVGMVADDTRLQKARKVVEALATYYGATVNPQELNRHLGKYRVATLRFKKGEVTITSVPQEK